MQANNLDKRIEAVHGGVELLLSHSSPTSFYFRKQEVNICPGELLIFNGNEPHTEVYKGKKAALNAVILRDSIFEDMLGDAEINIKNFVFKEYKFTMSHDLKLLINYIFAARKLYKLSQFQTESICLELAEKILTRYEHTEQAKISKLKRRGYFPQQVTLAKRVIYDNLLNSDFNLEILSKKVGLSKFHLLRSFKNKYGITPSEYRRQLLLDFSKSKLSSSDAPIISIAFNSGFNDISTFNKMFKKHTDLTPSQYREQCKAN
ncbi:MAG: helix-turn-helix transcriptional regulator [Bdellovibrionales bacterium]|nr:helix-turn-helix transcriptional regulator [Bdellovibrionales bacterium]